MSYQAIKEYLTVILERYKKLNKKGKTHLLNEATQVTGLTRKHLIRLLKQPAEALANRKSSGRRRKYLPEVFTPHIRHLWEQMERISGRRMKAAYPDWLPFYDHPDCTPGIQIGLQEMSVSTLERFLRGIRGGLRASKGLSTTCPAYIVKPPHIDGLDLSNVAAQSVGKKLQKLFAITARYREYLPEWFSGFEGFA